MILANCSARWAAVALTAVTALGAAPALADDDADVIKVDTEAPAVDAAAAETGVAEFADPPPASMASPAIPANRLVLSSRNSLRLNPIGLQSENTLVYQRRLMDSTSSLFNNTYFNIGLYNRLSPAFITAGPTLAIQPTNILTVAAGVEFNQYFGNFDQILSWEDAGVDYHDSVQDDLGGDVSDPPENYKTNGYHAFIRPSFQIKGGPVVVKTAFSLEYWGLNLEGDDTLFYDFTGDMLVPNKGWTVFNDTDLLYFTPKRLIIGARYSRVAPKYKAENFTVSAEGSVNNNQQRAGLIAILPVGKQPKFSAFHSQALIAILSYYVQHNYRGPSGTKSDAYDPEAPLYFALVYAFTSDFLK